MIGSQRQSQLTAFFSGNIKPKPIAEMPKHGGKREGSGRKQKVET
jgi:hypothetical protein